MGRHVDALNYFKTALNESPSNLDALTACAMSMMELSQYQESLIKSDKAIKVDPHFSKAYLSKAITLHKLQNFSGALENYLLALKYDGASQLAQVNIASVLISEIKSLSDFDRAIEAASKSKKLTLQAKYGSQRNLNLIEGIPFFRLKHDLQQAIFLKANGIYSKAMMEFVDIFNSILEMHVNYGGQDLVQLDAEALKAFRDYSLEPHIYETPKIKDSLLNGELDWNEIQENYLSATPELVFIDDFLTPSALHAFQSFSLFSKVWHKEYKGSYLGAFANQGFISHLHLKLAIDFRQAMPKVFQDFPLGQLWGFKYDAQLGSGINVHADFAKVNLNFWITPSESNLDLGTGGLKVYNVPAPSTWTFNDYNRESKHIYDFLDKNNSTSVNIPYRGNRAVLFNSALFHETDAINFKEGYENRRVNMTYLFGSQLA
jgi:tetratricopeptide (TPR) repeat protein